MYYFYFNISNLVPSMITIFWEAIILYFSLLPAQFYLFLYTEFAL